MSKKVKHSGAIIIDCWNMPGPSMLPSYDNIKYFIKNQPNLDLVLFATYPCTDTNVSTTKQSPYWKVPWEQHVRHFLPKENYWDKSNQYYSNVDFHPPAHVKNWWKIFNNHNIFHQEILKENVETQRRYGPFLNYDQTYHLLVSVHPRKNQTILGCWTIDQLTYLCNDHFSHISKLYFLGGSWEQCMQEREVGIPFVIDAIRSKQLNHITQIATVQNHIYNSQGHTLHNFGNFGFPGWIPGDVRGEFLFDFNQPGK